MKRTIFQLARRPRWHLDLGLVICITVLAALASSHWEVAEFLDVELRPFNWLQLDEAPGVLLVLSLCLLWYSWRRYREAADALQRSHEAEEKLGAALADNQRLIHQQVEMQELERTRLGRELHDELGQYLNAIKIDVLSLRELQDRPAQVAESLDAVLRNLDYVHEATARLIRQLRPVALDELGLEAALEHCLDVWRGRLPGVALALQLEGDFSGIAQPVSLTLYRLAQEGLTNAARHSMASEICLRLSYANPQQGWAQLQLRVEDNGRGAEAASASAGLGLIGMRERVQALGGELRVDSAAGHGFRLSADIPMATKDFEGQ